MDAVPSVVVANAAAAALLFAAAAGVCAVARSPAVAHKAWLLVLLKLVTPPLVVLPVVWPELPEASEPRGLPPRTDPPVETVVTDPADRAPEFDPDGVTGPPEPPIDPGPAPPDGGDEPRRSLAADSPAPFPWRSALTAAWLGGAAAYWLLVAARVARFRRALRGASPAPAAVVALARRTADRLGLRTLPRVVFVDAAVSPMVWAGLGRPELILPKPLWESLTGEQREAVLAHELAHLRRGDHWVRRLELVALGLYWWFPVAWLACRRLRDAEEACCDAWVVWALPGRAAAYAEALVETVAFVSRPGWVPLASGGAARAGALKRRLAMILSNTPARRGRRVVGFGLLAAGLLVLPLRPGWADDVVKPAAEPPAGDPGDVLVFKYSDEPKMPSDGPAKRTDLRLPSKYEPAPADAAALRDELELLEAQGQTKAAQVRAAETAVAAAERQVGLFQKLGKDTVSQAELANLQSTLETARAQLDVRKAEFNEHAVKVKQVKRRLEAALAPAADAAALTRKKAVEALDAEVHKLRPAETNRLKSLQQTLASAETAVKDLAEQRRRLAAELKTLTDKQDAMTAHIEMLRLMLAEMHKKYPDATRPAKP